MSMNSCSLETKQTLITPHTCSDHPFIGTRLQAPQWMIYEQLSIGYRINFHSIKLILRSLFLLHNQTVNVWTHLIGAIIFIIVSFLTCTETFDSFYLSFHQPYTKSKIQNQIGSGGSFVQNLTHTTFDLRFYYDNSSSINQLIRDICSKQNDKYRCYIEKSHQRKLRNWIEYHFSQHFDNFQQIKVRLQTQIIPKYVHIVENQISTQENNFLSYLKTHLFKNQKDQTQQNQENKFKEQDNKINKDKFIDQQLSDKISNNEKYLSKWPLVLFLICNAICLLCSVIYHLFYPLSQKAHNLCVCTDFAGISVHFGGSAIPCIYYGMYCYFEVGQLYIVGIIICSTLVFALSFTNKFNNRNDSKFRVLVYTVFAGFMLTPLFHMTINQILFNNFNDSYSFVSSIEWYTLGMVLMGIGGLFYGSQFPNRFAKQGKYDILGHSHHYWHLFVFLSISTFYLGSLQNYYTRRYSTCGN